MTDAKQKPHTVHTPVLLDEVIAILNPQAGERYLDVTAGYGGHARAVLTRTQAPAQAVLVDRDEQAINELQDLRSQGANCRHEDFLQASQALLASGQQFDLILADLGVSSPHLNQAERGFAFSATGPLDMRMDRRRPVTAEELVNTASARELTDILRRYGEEPKAAQIARLIIGHRPLHTTAELAAVVAKAWPGHSRVHPATRTFQALRIAVNDELRLLEQSLPLWVDLLAQNGRLAVISFHSLEDRLVKQFFSEQGGNRYDAQLQILTKRPILPGPAEIATNPRARSAKLRAAVKTKNKKGKCNANSGKKQLPGLQGHR